MEIKIWFVTFSICLMQVIAEDLETFEINWKEVTPIQYLKEFWKNNNFPNGIQRTEEDLKKLEKFNSARITNGMEVVKNSLPYQAAIVLKLLFNQTYLYSFCGGSIYNPNYIVTAAHCVERAELANVILGGHNLSDITDINRQVFLVNKTDMIIHKCWNATVAKNDIALLKISKGIKFNNFVQPIPFAFEPCKLSGFMATASGWGYVSDKLRSISSVLRSVNIPIISNEVCEKYYTVIRDSIICTNGTNAKSICGGDSGGPLVIGGVQVGISSFASAKGCEIGRPNGFTRVSSYYDWLLANTK